MARRAHSLRAFGPALIVAALVSPAPALAQRTAPATTAEPRAFDALFPTPPEVTALPNGVRVVTVAWPSPGIVAYYTLVRAGSRDEVEEGHTGFAHFFEHMMFRGTEAHPAADYAARLEAVGADGNAFTTSDYTCYTIVAPRSALDLVVELESDRFQHLAYAEDAFRTEAGAVRGEYQVWSSDPSTPMWEALSEIAFTEHTYGHTTIGYLADIEAMPGYYDYSRAFFRRFYTPDDTTVIVVGDFDREALLARVREAYGGWRGRRDRPRIPTEPEPTAGARRDLGWDGPTAPQLYVGYRVPAFVGERTRGAARARALRETAALQTLYLLAFDDSAPLVQRLVVEQRTVLGLATGLGEQSRDPGLFYLTLELSPETMFDPIVSAVQGELDRIGRGEIDAERLSAAASHLRYGMAMALETPASVAGFLASMLAVAPDLGVVRGYFDELARVTSEDVARVARTYLTSARRFVVTLREGAGEGDTGAPAGAGDGGAS